ncbi:MAG: HAD-IIIA family hydrolase, partial [Candidatus Nealsonbacteria bacterium]
YGDVMLDIDIRLLLEFHRKKKSACTLALHPNDHPQDSDLVEIDANQRIAAFHPKPHSKNEYLSNLVNAGLYVISPEILKYIKRGVKTDWGKDVFPKIVRKEMLYGYITAEYLKDIGTPKRLSEVRKDYQDGKIPRMNRKNKKRAIFLDRDGVINETESDVSRINDFKLFPKTAQAVKQINDSEFLAIVITNQPAVAKGFCSMEELENIHKKMETLLGENGAKLDGIYFCPHHPDKGFAGENLKYKIKCSCRKPKIGLVKMAEKDFNIDLKHSYFIGDSSRDILCGRKAGMTTIGVKTGRGCRDGKIKPDFLFEDLKQAINFII